MNSLAYIDFISSNLRSTRKNNTYEKLKFIHTMIFGYKEPTLGDMRISLPTTHNVKQYYDTIRNSDAHRLVVLQIGAVTLQLQQSPYGEYIKTLIIAIGDKSLFIGDINCSGVGRFSRAVDLGIGTIKLNKEESDNLLKLLNMMVNVGLLRHTDGMGKFYYSLGIGNKRHIEAFRIRELEETVV